MNKLIFVFIAVLTIAVNQSAAKKHHTKHVTTDKGSKGELKTLRELLGKPKENPGSAKAFKGTRKTTRLHKICSWKKHLKNKPDEWTEDKTVYDKLICGFYTMQDEYQKHSHKAAAILSGQNSQKSLEEQKKDLFNAIHNMAKASGPLPRLNLKMIGR
ncbi:uncharacterized protein LOC110245493 [Exaiptasia diaphana]|uniref:Uncharacterized protein n=1 Tax=Exaiptasia diaphana TaxID=2652724 RepID=A0A913XP42_EXADI|nr:uncharacterized protein LOC110245493 [Exaiptasia diaphana]KXJ10402.1 hypothetical protein AC249_AIPGENE23523 [Exaiptasia diaphana]